MEAFVIKKGNPYALIPIIVFITLFIGLGIYKNNFYVVPAVVAFLIALVVAFFQNKKLSFNEKLNIVAKGAGDENIMIMCLIFLFAGAFSSTVTATGGVDSIVNLSLSFLPGNLAVVGVFIIACFISVSMGTSVGTIAALAPIAIGISEKTGINISICIAAVVSGAMFGDNLSMISDTTIAAVRTQGCNMKDKFKENFFIVFPAAIATIIILSFIAYTPNYDIAVDLDYNIFKIIPYIIILVGALLGVNVLILLFSGVIVSSITGIIFGDFRFFDTFSIINSGCQSMYDIVALSIVVAGTVALIHENGGIDCIIYSIKRFVKTKKGAQIGIALLASVTDLATANNTVAIVVSGPIAKEISEDYSISAKRTASLLDIFTSVCQGLIPYGSQLLIASNMSGLTPIDIIPYSFYPVLMGISAIIFILFKKENIEQSNLPIKCICPSQ